LERLPEVYANLKAVLKVCTAQGIEMNGHPLSTIWKYLWLDTPLSALARVPGTTAALTIMGSVALWVSFRMYQTGRRGELLFPYLMLLAAAATFLPRV